MRKVGSRGSSPAQRVEIGLGLLLVIVATQLAGTVVLARTSAAPRCGADPMSYRSNVTGACHVR
jgi:hypothetical protein